MRSEIIKLSIMWFLHFLRVEAGFTAFLTLQNEWRFVREMPGFAHQLTEIGPVDDSQRTVRLYHLISSLLDLSRFRRSKSVANHRGIQIFKKSQMKDKEPAVESKLTLISLQVLISVKISRILWSKNLNLVLKD